MVSVFFFYISKEDETMKPKHHLWQQVKTSIVSHTPGILTGVGIASFGTSVIFAVTATPKAMRLLEEKQKETDKELEPVEIVKTTWKCYIPSAVMFGIGAGCTIGGLKVSERRGAAWATAYSLSESAFREYREKIVEKLGERKEKQARDEIAQEKINENPVKNIDVIQTGRGTTICKDLATERTFTVDIDDIPRAEEYVINQCKEGVGYCSWNELYLQLNVGDTGLGEDLGWNAANPLRKIIVSSCLGADGAPMLAIDYMPRPYADFWKIERY